MRGFPCGDAAHSTSDSNKSVGGRYGPVGKHGKPEEQFPALMLHSLWGSPPLGSSPLPGRISVKGLQSGWLLLDVGFWWGAAWLHRGCGREMEGYCGPPLWGGHSTGIG